MNECLLLLRDGKVDGFVKRLRPQKRSSQNSVLQRKKCYSQGFVGKRQLCTRITSYNVCYTKLLRKFRQFRIDIAADVEMFMGFPVEEHHLPDEVA